MKLMKLIVAFAAIAAGLTATPEQSAAAPAQKPNIVFILADDIGYGDFGCYGATRVKTPNLDKLAAQGLRFTDAHSPSAVCTPTRYAFLTGQYAWRNPAGARILPGDAPLSIRPGTLTVPELLKQAGYVTGIVGKWHLGLGGTNGPDWNGEIKPGPLEIGFNHAFIIPATGDRTPCVFVENHRVFNLDPKDQITVDYKNSKPGHSNDVKGIGRIGSMTGGKAALWDDEAIADTLQQRAVKFIEENEKRPFFLYLATHDIHVPRVPAKQFRGASQAGVRGDAIVEFDWTVGKVLDALDRLGLTHKTLVMVSSDNGGILDYGDTVERDGDVQTNQGHAFNGKLRGTKGTPYEGGTRVPLIARWPGRIQAGRVSAELVCLVDMLSTVAAITGRQLPQEAGPDSFNLLPALSGSKSGRPVREHLVEHGSRMAIRLGPWKYISTSNAQGGKAKGAGNTTPELYNLEEDLSETKNLAEQHPDKVKELAALLDQIRQNGRSRP